MAKVLAEFTQGLRPSNTTNVMRISQSGSDPKSIYVQLVKYRAPSYSNGNDIMHFKVKGDDIDDIITVLMYAKKVIVDD